MTRIWKFVTIVTARQRMSLASQTLFMNATSMVAILSTSFKSGSGSGGRVAANF